MDIVTNLYNLYESAPVVLQWLGNFLFSVIIVRGIIANEILREIREKRAWHWIVREWDEYWSAPRNAAIRGHFSGNHNTPIEQCTFDKCNSL